MRRVLHAGRGQRVLNDNGQVLQDDPAGQVGQLALEERALAPDAASHVDKDGRLGVYHHLHVTTITTTTTTTTTTFAAAATAAAPPTQNQGGKVEHVEPGRPAAEGRHPESKLGDQVRAVEVGPLKGWEGGVVDELEGSVGDGFGVLEGGGLEEVGGLDDGGGDDAVPVFCWGGGGSANVIICTCVCKFFQFRGPQIGFCVLLLLLYDACTRPNRWGLEKKRGGVERTYVWFMPAR